jgi:hypothetical protein
LFSDQEKQLAYSPLNLQPGTFPGSSIQLKALVVVVVVVVVVLVVGQSPTPLRQSVAPTHANPAFAWATST